MQSQQKKVKWSRGETADALEERTDTGITEVSVSKLENIVADIYGNIARRPAFKIIESDPSATDLPIIEGFGSIDAANFGLAPQSFVFTVDESTYIIFIVGKGISAFGGLLIRNGKFVKRVAIDNTTGWSVQYTTNKPISAAQYNNFMVVSNLYLADVVLRLTDTNDITVEPFQFSGPWASPNGTQTKTVSGTELPGLEFNKDGLGFTGYAWTDDAGNSSPYSQIDTGLSGSTDAIAEEIPVGSIVKFPNMGAYMRIEGYTQGGHTIYYGQYTFDSATKNNNPSPTGLCVDAWLSDHYVHLWVYNNGVRTGESIKIRLKSHPTQIWVQNSDSQTGYSKLDYSALGIIGWADVTPGSLDVRAFGPLLTPAVEDSVKDSLVTVEYGYVSTDDYNPTQFVFSDQRLYAAGFESADMSPQVIPGFAVGSQIGRFTDFKNDYNAVNEAVTIDISTAYQERIVAMIDYNGLKIFTDSAEYAYKGGAIIKQSANGSLATCDPLVVSGVCIYADKSGQQLRALQYEFNNDLFKSTSINQMAQEDLIFNTTSMASMLDKEHYSGRFLYAPQHKYNFANPLNPVPYAEHSLAVCNFVPGNQAMIWGRWTSPTIRPNTDTRYEDKHSIANVVEVNNKVWFVMACATITSDSKWRSPAYTLAELDYDNLLDVETTAAPTDTEYRIIDSIHPHDLHAWVDTNNPDNVVYTLSQDVMQDDPIYDADENQISTADNSPGGPNIIIGGVGYYQWGTGPTVYTKTATPEPTGSVDDPSRALYDSNGDLIATEYILAYNPTENYITYTIKNPIGPAPVSLSYRVVSTDLEYTIEGVQYTSAYDNSKNIYAKWVTMCGSTVSVFDGDTYKWDDTLTEYGELTQSISELTNPRIGFKIDALLESHPLDIEGKTYTEKKRIGKTVAVIRDTEPGTFTVCDKTGYTSTDKKTVNFYGCTGMKDQVRYTIKNIQGAKFTIESLTMIIEYGTLDS